MPKSYPTVMKLPNTTSGFPAWGSDKGTRNPQGLWPQRPVGFDYRTSTGLGETWSPVLEGTNKILHEQRPRRGRVIPLETEPNYLIVLESLLWSQQGLTTGTGTPVWEGPPWWLPLTMPAELFEILKEDAVKVLHSICQQIWKTQQWPQDWKWSVFIPIPKKGNDKES